MPAARPGPGPSHAAPDGRLAFLDGLRGLAALYVVLHHAMLEVPGLSGRRLGQVVWGLLRHGHFAVAAFIVLSGYCLMRPVAADPEGRLRGGIGAYLGRRARRILPPYYAALLLCWLLTGLVPGMNEPARVRWDRALPAFAPGVVVSHLLLVHNLHESWIFKVDPPLWSVATEWQIYAFFPALVVLWRRHGMALAVASAFAAGAAVAALGGGLGNPALVQLCPWYAGLFALGMAAAAASLDRPRPSRGSRSTLLFAWWLGLAALGLAGLAARWGADVPVMIADLIAGSAAALLIIACARRVRAGMGLGVAGSGMAARGLVLTLLESRVAAGLGSISYSLYLVHFPLLALVGRQVRSQGVGWAWEARLGAMLVGAPAFCLVAAYAFHRLFERPVVARASTVDLAVT